MISRIVYLTICGLILAGIVHAASILLIPTLGSKDAARQIIRSAPALTFNSLEENDRIQLAAKDPFFKTAVCRFNLEQGGIFVTADRASAFWSAAVYDARGRVLYSLSDRTAIANKLQLLIVSPVQMAAIRQLQPVELETSIVVETGAVDGFILLRSLVRDESLLDQSQDFMQSAMCLRYEPVAG